MAVEYFTHVQGFIYPERKQAFIDLVTDQFPMAEHAHESVCEAIPGTEWGHDEYFDGQRVLINRTPLINIEPLEYANYLANFFQQGLLVTKHELNNQVEGFLIKEGLVYLLRAGFQGPYGEFIPYPEGW
jgi:hypothetical protein